MTMKWMGALLILTGCGGWGFLLAAAYHRQEIMLRRLREVLQAMQWEMQYRLTPLPELCRMAAKDSPGELGSLFRDLGRELDRNAQPDGAGCMTAALERHPNLPPKVKTLLRQLGRTLGRFDLEGQIGGMESVRKACEDTIGDLQKDRDIRLRSYRTLGLCAGAALIILFA